MNKKELRKFIPIVITETGDLSPLGARPIGRVKLGKVADAVGRLVAVGDIPLSDGRSVQAVAKTIAGQIFDGLNHDSRVMAGEIAMNSFLRVRRKV